MAKISELTETTVPASTDKVPIVQSETTKYVQVGNLLSSSSVDINGGTIDGTTIGGTTPAAGSFTSLTGMGWTLSQTGSFIATLASTKTLPAITFASTSALTVTLGQLVLSGAHTITASTTQTQAGGTVIARCFNVVTTANTSDAITLPAAGVGSVVFILNNAANTIQVFPASGDAIGAGSADAATTQTTKTGKLYIAGDSTTWIVF